MGTLLRRVRHWIRHRQVEADLAEELETHRALTQERLEQAGMPAIEARHASRRALGNVTLAREDAREVWTWPSIEQIWRDARHGARMLRAHPTFAAAAILTLAVGIGATATALTVVDAELWRPLPFPEADRLVAIHTTGQERSATNDPVSVPDFLDWQSQSRAFEELAAFRWTSRHVLRGGEAAESVRVMPVTPNFFTALRRMPALGRSFDPEDRGSSRPVMLSDGGWRRLFAADPQVVGRTIALDDEPHVVIGVSAPDRLEFVDDPDLFQFINLATTAAGDRRVRDLVTIGRLKKGVSRGAAETELRTVAKRLADDYPADHAGRGVRVDGLREAHTGWNWRPLIVFLGSAVVVLLLSCANVANLLLARAVDRRREFAIRGALGGGRTALVRQLVVEGALLALPGAGAGILLAAWALALVSAWLPPGYVGRGGQFALDLRVLVPTIAAASLTAIVFGLAPAFFTGRRDLTSTLTQGGRTIAGSPAEQRARHALVVAEVTLALVMVVGAGLFLNSFARLTQLPLGFDASNRLMMRIPVLGARYAETSQLAAFSESLVDEIRALPGVVLAAIGSSAPLEGTDGTSFVVAGQRPASGEDTPRGLIRAVTPAYFRTLDIRLIAGRAFTARDVDGVPRVAVINERLARRFFAGENPVGRALVLQPRASLRWVKSGTVEIVGIVSNIKDVGLNEVDFNNIYVPFAQSPASSIKLIVSTGVPAESVVEEVRGAVHRLDSNLPVVGIETMAQRVRGAMRSDRFNLALVGAFAAIALALASVGIYGVMAHAVAQRTQEFGVRLALGAGRADILRLALGQSVGLGLLGTALGLCASLALARALGNALYLVQGQHEGLVYGVTLTDPLTLSCACLTLLGVAALAGLIPARRATRVDPVIALRAE